MKIVIDISEEMYNFVCNYPEKVLAGYSLCIKNGTPLPKGHGRLIDADELEECKEVMNTIMGESKYAIRMDDVRNAPTIIEAESTRIKNEKGKIYS